MASRLRNAWAFFTLSVASRPYNTRGVWAIKRLDILPLLMLWQLSDLAILMLDLLQIWVRTFPNIEVSEVGTQIFNLIWWKVSHQSKVCLQVSLDRFLGQIFFEPVDTSKLPWLASLLAHAMDRRVESDRHRKREELSRSGVVHHIPEKEKEGLGE